MAKFLVLILIILVVWNGYKWLVRSDAVRRAQALARAQAEQRREARDKVEVMVACRSCGVYVPAAGASPCGRADCPYRRQAG